MVWYGMVCMYMYSGLIEILYNARPAKLQAFRESKAGHGSVGYGRAASNCTDTKHDGTYLSFRPEKVGIVSNTVCDDSGPPRLLNPSHLYIASTIP